MVSDDAKAIKLPKPVTITGSAFPDPKPDPDVADGTQIPETDDNGELPMPVAVYEDVDEDVSLKKTELKPNPQAPLTNLLPEIVPASSDPSKGIESSNSVPTQSDDLPSIALPPLPDLTTAEEKVVDDIQPMGQSVNKTEDLVADSIALEPEPSLIQPMQQDEVNTEKPFTLPQIDINKIPEEITALSGDQITNNYPPQSMQNVQIPTYEVPSSMNVPSVTNAMNQSVKPANNFGKIMLGIGIFLIGGGLVVGGYFGFNALKNKSESKAPSIAYQEPKTTPRPIQSPLPEKSATPSASPKGTPKMTPKSSAKPVVDDAIKIQILNGSGKKGDTLIAKDIITSSKYDITTGNADNFDYIGLGIEYKEEYESTAQELGKSLEKTYGKATLEATLKDAADYDIIITLGSLTTKSSSSPSPASSATPKTSPAPTPKP